MSASRPLWVPAARSWLASYQDDLDRMLAAGLHRVATVDVERVPAYHRAGSQSEQYSLNAGHDLCYDRPGTGFAYAAWYHPRRVHDLVRRFLHLGDDLLEGPPVVDLGAGTGAAAWAIGLVLVARQHATGEHSPCIDLVALDASPSMLETGRILWETAIEHEPRLDPVVAIQWERGPWLDPPRVAEGGWVLAAHLFDSSDSIEETRLQFRRMLVGVEPERVLVDAPQMKQTLVMNAVAGAEEAGWSRTRPPRVAEPLWDGPLPETHAIRRSHLVASGVPDHSIRKPPSWEAPHPIRADLDRGAPSGGQLFHTGPLGLALDDDQDRAARPEERYEVLIGAAGSGKSVVLVERVARSLDTSLRRGEVPAILVTSRNRAMVDQLHGWLLDRLESVSGNVVSTSRDSGDHLITLDTRGVTARIRLLNWDKVPTQLFGRPATGLGDRDAIDTRIRQLDRDGWSALDQYPDYLRSVEWLNAELRRVLYAQRIFSLGAYLEADRIGRRRPLPPQVREPVWELLMGPGMQASYTYKWMQLAEHHANVLETGEPLPDPNGTHAFTHAFVDEVQDFTDTDLRFAAAMLPDARRLYCVGDAGQAMLLGSTFETPGILRGRRREVTRLTHSYRLGRRLAEAVEPLAQHILDQSPRAQQAWVGVPAGTRSGVIGCRPIIIRDGPDSLDQLAEALTNYRSITDLPEASIVIAEAFDDHDLIRCARSSTPRASVAVDQMARIKGLERTCIIWRSSHHWSVDESAAEFVHTVLTRAQSLAVIILDPERTSSDVATAIGRLRGDRLLFWDDAARAAWESLPHS